MPDVVLAVLVFGPLAITYFLKSNAALSFLALCAGFVLSTSVIGDLKHLLSETNLSVTNDTLAALLIALPFLLTLILTRHGHAKGPLLIAQLAAAVAGGGLLALSIGPLLTASSPFNVTSASLWSDLSKIQASVIGVGGLISLLLVWTAHSHRSKKH
jgi:hypothetical protein